MEPIANLLFEAATLKRIPRSGYHFLGAGGESVAEHSFIITFIAYVMSRMEPDADAGRLLAMCLVHDLPEARTGDLNSVWKQYVSADEPKAVAQLAADLPFGESIADLIAEYNDGETLAARLAHDADQLAFILDLKALSDIGHLPPKKWLPAVTARLRTPTGRRICQAVLDTPWDTWWLEKILLTDSGETTKS